MRALDELGAYLTVMDGSKIEKITDRLMECVEGFIIDRKSLGERSKMGSARAINHISRAINGIHRAWGHARSSTRRLNNYLLSIFSYIFLEKHFAHAK
jgi:hypothetical protein